MESFQTVNEATAIQTFISTLKIYISEFSFCSPHISVCTIHKQSTDPQAASYRGDISEWDTRNNHRELCVFSNKKKNFVIVLRSQVSFCWLKAKMVYNDHLFYFPLLVLSLLTSCPSSTRTSTAGKARMLTKLEEVYILRYLTSQRMETKKL